MLRINKAIAHDHLIHNTHTHVLNNDFTDPYRVKHRLSSFFKIRNPTNRKSVISLLGHKSICAAIGCLHFNTTKKNEQ